MARDAQSEALASALKRLETEDPSAMERLVTLLYDELRLLAHKLMRGEASGSTLQTTALVHEAWERLRGGDGGEGFHDERHFMGAAAQAMRRVLVDRARERSALKRGGDRQRVDSGLEGLASALPSQDILALDSALEKLRASDPNLVCIVELRFFAGLSVEETARILGCSTATVKREWACARLWLHRELRPEDDGDA